MIRNNDPQPPNRDEQIADQEELQAAAAASSQGVRTAAQKFMEERDNFLDELAKPEVDSEDFGNLSGILGPDLSRAHILANKTKADLRRHRFLNENEMERIEHDHNPGRLCKGPFAAMMQGVHDRPDQPVKKPLTQDEKRKIRQAGEVKYSRQTLGEDKAGLKAVSEITTNTHVDRPGGDDSSDGGRIRGAIGRVFS